VHIVIDTNDPDRYRAAFRYVLRPARIRLAIMGGVLVLLGAVTALLPATLPLGIVEVVAGLMLGIVLPLRVIGASIRGLSSVVAGPTRFELTDQYVGSISPLMSSQTAWAAFTRIDEIPGQLLLRIGRRQVISVPITDVHPAQLAELREFVANRNFIAGARASAAAPPGPAPVPPDGLTMTPPAPTAAPAPPGAAGPVPQPRTPWPGPPPGVQRPSGDR
jgi:hypothetical protein